MAELEKAVRSIEMDGLVWGASKFVPIGYGIKKLQITLVVGTCYVHILFEFALTGGCGQRMSLSRSTSSKRKSRSSRTLSRALISLPCRVRYFSLPRHSALNSFFYRRIVNTMCIIRFGASSLRGT